jgi:DNA-binding beta-propeller fold protein YncE
MVITVAGATAPGYTDGKGSAARFNGPEGIAYDSAEKALYVCDINNFEIRRVTPDGEVKTVAGSPLEGRQDGTGPDARFSHPIGIAYDSHDGALYVTDNSNHAVRRMTAGGVVTTVAGGREGFADGIGPNARFRGPLGIAFDASDGDLYVSDPGNGRIRRVTPDGAVTTYSGNGGFGSSTGSAATARWGTPEGIAWDQFDNSLYVADSLLNTVRRISAAGIVSNIAGDGARGRYDGVFEGAEFKFPIGVAVDPSSGYLYIADDDNNLVRLIK